MYITGPYSQMQKGLVPAISRTVGRLHTLTEAAMHAVAGVIHSKRAEPTGRPGD